MNTYYEVEGFHDGQREVLFGSFDRTDCVEELDAERVAWKADGYKALKIVSRDTQDAPDADVYADVLVTKKGLFLQQAPSFNFELGEDELLAEALRRGYVTAVEGVEDQYLINRNYGEAGHDKYTDLVEEFNS